MMPLQDSRRWRRVTKRDGRVVLFKISAITAAIAKACAATGEGTVHDARACAHAACRILLRTVPVTKVPHVEQIQDAVERALMEKKLFATAKAYITYRYQHAEMRDAEHTLDAAVDLIDAYVAAADWKVKENANMAFSLQGLNNYIASSVSSAYWMRRIYPAEIRKAHEEGDFHIHDLQLVSAYCCGWDLQDLLVKGFTGVAGKISCAPAKHFGSALGQMVNFIYTMQGEVAGAQAFANVDTLLAPFVRHDKLSYAEVKQHIQTFVFNMNVSTRVGFQTPFSNITMDIMPPKNLADKPVIIGGRPQKTTYGAYQEEMNMINKAFAEVMMAGDASGRVFTFPIPTYNIGKDFRWEDPRFEPIWEMTAKYGIPYFANFVNSDMDPDDARSMCCRLRLDNRELRRRGGGLFGANPLTGSIGVVTINLPRIGYNAQNKKEFLRQLDRMMDYAQESLEIKRKVIERLTEQGLYPYVRVYLAGIKQSQGGYWKNHFATIGLVGMHEALQNLLGVGITDSRGHDFAQEVLAHMRTRIQMYQERTGNLYNLEATPAEGTSYRLALLDQKRCPGMIFANASAVRDTQAAPYYTNSTHLPVGYTQDIFAALDLQDDLQTQYTGGTVLHGFLGERLWDTVSTKMLVRRIAESYKLPYFTLTPTFSICPAHGYLAGEQSACPHCHAATEVYTRIVGYIRPVAQWNKGKQAEYGDRTEYVPQQKQDVRCAQTHHV